MIEVKNLTKKFKKTVALNDVSLSFRDGVFGLLGANGAGKTTLMRSMLGLYKIQQGDILYDGKSIKKDDTFAKQIGYLPQKFGLFRELSVYEMMEYIATLKGIEKKTQREEIEKRIDEVNLTEKTNDKVRSLSGGMIRRLGIAQALLGDAKIIIVDEPTAGLDPEERVRFKNLLSMVKKDKTIIISTHIVEDVEALCTDIVIINKGGIIGAGDSKSIKEIANNKVFIVDAEHENKLKGNYFVEKRFYDNDKTMLRVISDEKQIGKIAPATIEDGYICRVKGMG